MKIVVGLGNPGPEYAGTRHNVGFDVVGEVAARLGWVGRATDFDRMARSKFEGLALDGVMSTAGGSEKLLLLKPLTYMNLSGKSVLAAIQFYQVSAQADLLVVLDDLALPCGQIRLRAEGSSGGHNGLKDIERALGCDRYPRLRVGIDAKPPRIPQADYVLQKFTPEQRAKLDGTDGAIAKSAGCIMTWADQGLNKAMNQFNIKDGPATEQPKVGGKGGGGVVGGGGGGGVLR